MKLREQITKPQEQFTKIREQFANPFVQFAKWHFAAVATCSSWGAKN